jgi:hypothetical protein
MVNVLTQRLLCVTKQLLSIVHSFAASCSCCFAAANQAIGSKLAACLLAPSAFTFGMDLMAQYEGGAGGMQW